MKIDRHNYEEYFVLYWDNELTAAEKKLVEVFVMENNDLKDEFRLFGETRFTPDENISFREKDLLLNETASVFETPDHTEKLLSYIDDELTTSQKIELEKFISTHPAIQQELSVLQKTKLQPDLTIVFPDKSILYRREEKVRVFRMTWMRVAVAAALILMAGLATFRIINSGKKDGTPSIVEKSAPKEILKSEDPSSTVIAKQEKTKEEQNKPANNKSKKSVLEKIPVQNTVAKLEQDNKNNLPKEKRINEQQQIAQNTAPALVDETNDIEPRKITNDAIVSTEQEKKNTLFEKTNVTERPSSTYTVYNAPADEKENADKGGLKGFLRKATRVIEHRTRMQTTTDDDKLLVGMFAVSLK